MEKIIGKQSTLLPIAFLEVGLQKARSVVRVLRGDGASGSDFLTDTNLLITNHHVLATEQEVSSAKAQFNYQQTVCGLDLAITEFRLGPQAGFATSKANDWTAARFGGDPRGEWGGIPLRRANP